MLSYMCTGESIATIILAKLQKESLFTPVQRMRRLAAYR